MARKLSIQKLVDLGETDPQTTVAAAHLTKRQQRLLDALMDGQSAEEALQEAQFTYAGHQGRRTLQRILTSPAGQQYVQQQLEVRERIVIPLQMARKEWLMAILQIHKDAPMSADKLRALEMYGKAQGWFDESEKMPLPPGLQVLWEERIRRGLIQLTDIPPKVLQDYPALQQIEGPKNE